MKFSTKNSTTIFLTLNPLQYQRLKGVFLPYNVREGGMYVCVIYTK
jgi:hypothetical protein